MSLIDQIEAARNYKMTPERVEEMRTRIAEADKRFAKEAQERAMSKKWLDRVYSDIPDYK
jgi:bisphosphoglycerate-dependent phosphoglycerate mutase